MRCINALFEGYQWLDAKVSLSESGDAKIDFYISYSYSREFSVIFKQVFYIMVPVWFTFEGEVFLSELSNDESKEMNLRYSVEKGNTWFSLNCGAEFEGLCFITCESVIAHR